MAPFICVDLLYTDSHEIPVTYLPYFHLQRHNARRTLPVNSYVIA